MNKKQIINPTLRSPISENIKPVWNENCEILMLGSITAIDGMRKGFYYASKRNQFWELLDLSLNINEFLPLKEKLQTNYEKLKLNEISKQVFQENKKEIISEFSKVLLNHKIAICDVFQECYFNNNSSLDCDIILNNENYPAKNNKETIENILKSSNIKTIIVNSQFVEKEFYKMKIFGDFKVFRVTSPSPRKGKIETKIENWKSVFKDLLKNKKS